MKLSRSASYAIQAMLHLARNNSNADKPVPCKVLASEGKMPPRFLLQILRNLATQGLLTSTRGTEGGYSLSRKASEISLLEIIEAVDGPLEYLLPFEDNFPPHSKAKLVQALAGINCRVREELGAIQLDQLAQVLKWEGQGSVASFLDGAEV